MEDKSIHISEKELDGLLREAFLHLDTEATLSNKKAQEAVGSYTMRRSGFSAFFNFNRLGSLLFILSVFIFLNSLYRYLEPLVTKGDKRYEPVLGISTLKKEEISFIKNTMPQRPDKKVEIKTQLSIATKTPVYKRKENKNKIKPIVLISAEKSDSTSIVRPLAERHDSVVVNPIQALSDSTDPALVPEIKKITEPVTKTAKKTRPEKKVKPELSSKKGKTPKVRGGSRFRKNGTFIMKGGRYGKSRRIQR